MHEAKLIDKWSSLLPAPLRRAVVALVTIADQAGVPLYLVGGPVRDVLLGRPSLDFDFVAEGDATTLAGRLAMEVGARAVTHTTFGTATVRLDHAALDLAMARAESYRRPGALPSVQAASIVDDLRRRDFTVNAMALCLAGPDRGALIDPLGARDDLRARLIRVLHPTSFQDDATRILRAARYEARFGFGIEQETLALIRRDAGFLKSISPARIHHEFARIFHETEPERALLRLQEWGALAAVHPGLSFDDSRASAFAEVRRLDVSAVPAAYWPLLAWGIQESEITAVVQRLAVTRTQSESVAAAPRIRWMENGLFWTAMRASELVDALAPYPLPTLWAFAVMSHGPARDRSLEYLQRLRHVRPVLRGSDLEAMGVPPGPIVGELLRRLRIARLDAVVNSREEEKRFVLSLKPQTRTGGS